MTTEQKKPAGKKAEPAPKPAEEPQQRNIVSPCCKEPLIAYGYMQLPSGEVALDGYCCTKVGCGNEWNGDGTVLHWIEGD